MEKKKGLEKKYILMEIIIMVHFVTVKKMVKVNIYFQMVLIIMDILKTQHITDLVN